MDWIKRNLYFVIGSLVALALMGGGGWYFYSKLKANNEVIDKLNEQYSKLQELINQKPHPGRPPQSDNIALAQEQQKQLRDFMQKTRQAFQPIPPIPEEPKVSDQDFSSALHHTVDQLQKQATNSGVTLQPNYAFSFAAQINQMRFAAGSPNALSAQLGDVKAICDVLFQAKINSLEHVRRERVSTDDDRGPQSDYLNQKSITNELAVLTPYEVKFRCFTPELAAATTGLANSPYAMVLKTINVERAPVVEAPPEAAAPVVFAPTPQPVPVPTDNRRQMDDAFRRRYGLGPGGRRENAPQPAPTYVAPPPVAAAARPALTTVLDEKQLLVTMNIDVVKLLPTK